MWRDESKFNLFSINKELDRRRSSLKTIKHGRGHIVVWCWSYAPDNRKNGRKDVQKYIDEHIPLPFIFMHDNEPKHTARRVKVRFSTELTFCVGQPQSPDLNLIENQ